MMSGAHHGSFNVVNMIFNEPSNCLLIQLAWFADGIIYHKEVTDAEEYAKTQKDIDTITGWMKKRGLSLIIGKTKSMLVTKKSIHLH